MCQNILLLFVLCVEVTTKRNTIREPVLDMVDNKKSVLVYRAATEPTPTPDIPENVIDKFAETLIASERYLRTIVNVERKVVHLDKKIQEGSNNVVKYLTQILRILKKSENEEDPNYPRLVKMSYPKLIPRQFEDRAPRPVSSAQYFAKEGVGDRTGDAALDNRLGVLEGHIKNIQSGVDSIVSTISEVKNRQYSRTFTSANPRAEMGNSLDAMALITEFRKTLRDQKSKKCDCRTNRVDRSERYPSDCHEIQVQGFNVSGIYKIRPDDMDPFYVLCDLTTAGGGWTVFQNRFDGSQDFYKGWHDYEYGFGNLAGEFWLGLEKLNFLTNQKLYELRIEMESFHGQDAYAGYSVFTIGPEHEGYRISTLGSFYGTAGDSLSYHAGQKFSTSDIDNDEWKDGACATEHGGAWWYKECDKSNLNGKYTQVEEENRGQSIYWISFKGPNTPLSKTKMMIRPLPASKPIDYTEANRNILEGSKLRKPPNRLGATPEQIPRVRGDVMAQDSYSQYRYEEPVADTYFSNYA